MITYRQATEADVRELVPNLRESDIVELMLAVGANYENTLIKSIKHDGFSESAIDPDGNVIAILGCHSAQNNVGIPFMVCSDAVEKYPRNVVRDARARTKIWNEKYHILINMVYSGNKKTIKWLEHVGYVVDKNNPVKWGKAKADFYKFYRINSNV